MLGSAAEAVWCSVPSLSSTVHISGNILSSHHHVTGQQTSTQCGCFVWINLWKLPIWMFAYLDEDVIGMEFS